MGFPIIDREIDRMIRQEALVTPMSREMVRKGGTPQQTEPSGVVLYPRTVIDAYLSPTENPLARQYLVNLSEAERVRLSSQSGATVYVLYSESTESGPLDPGDWVALEDEDAIPVSASSATSDPGDPLAWRILPAEERTLLRMLVSTSATEPELDTSGAFSVALQVDA